MVAKVSRREFIRDVGIFAGIVGGIGGLTSLVSDPNPEWEYHNWTFGGGKRGYPGAGPSHFERIQKEGYDSARVTVSETLNTYGAEAWFLVDDKDFNDGRNYEVQFKWEALCLTEGDRANADLHAIQITDGDNSYWGNDVFASTGGSKGNSKDYLGPRGTKTIWQGSPSMTRKEKGASFVDGPGVWTLGIFGNPNGMPVDDAPVDEYDQGLNHAKAEILDSKGKDRGNMSDRFMLATDCEWNLRFIVAAATSMGYPAKEDELRLWWVRSREIDTFFHEWREIASRPARHPWNGNK